MISYVTTSLRRDPRGRVHWAKSTDVKSGLSQPHLKSDRKWHQTWEQQFSRQASHTILIPFLSYFVWLHPFSAKVSATGAVMFPPMLLLGVD